MNTIQTRSPDGDTFIFAVLRWNHRTLISQPVDCDLEYVISPDGVIYRRRETEEFDDVIRARNLAMKG